MRGRICRPVVTGLGVVSPLGVGASEFWRRLVAGERAPLVVPPVRPGLSSPGPGRVFVPEFEAERYGDPRALRKVSGLTRLATIAASLALEDAAFPADLALRDATSVSLGSSFGSSRYHLEYHEALRAKGLRAASALLFAESVFNAPAGHLSKVFRLRGASHTLVGGQDVGLAAVALAGDRIRLGVSCAALAGGADEHSDLAHASVRKLGLVGACDGGPFDPEPAPIGEGASILVLEEREPARRRGARLRAEIRGTGSARRGRGTSNEAAALSGVAQALRRSIGLAIEDAGVAASDLDLVVAGAAGGQLAQSFAKAIEELHRSAGREIPVATPKAALGEGFAYTSAALALVAVLALSTGEFPPLAIGEGAPRPPRLALAVDATGPGGATAIVLSHADAD
ncbi:MAG: hypothetical protein HY720_32305 [Planctomycetes bacterium]|nr:hypothetical protein [Planctomycetota bacterium]